MTQYVTITGFRAHSESSSDTAELGQTDHCILPGAADCNGGAVSEIDSMSEHLIPIAFVVVWVCVGAGAERLGAEMYVHQTAGAIMGYLLAITYPPSPGVKE